MEDMDNTLNHSSATNVQFHEIPPHNDGMSFGALLEKFYLNTEAAKNVADAGQKETGIVAAQDFVIKKTNVSGFKKA